MRLFKIFLGSAAVFMAVAIVYAYRPVPELKAKPTTAEWYQYTGTPGQSPYDFSKYTRYSTQPEGYPPCSGEDDVCGILIDPAVDVDGNNQIKPTSSIYMAIQDALDDDASNETVRLKDLP